ncbi:MAG: tRNA (adenosine(37)-N6)-dimethylallyltransferase MiaA, partial [Chloroflexi bacterium]
MTEMDSADSIVRSASTSANSRQLTPGLAVILVLGATATGKTALAVRLGLALHGEVVNADSRYLYRGMDIGTAKPTAAEMCGVPHHLIDIIDPLEDYSLARFLDDIYHAVEVVGSRGSVPIVAGGTPQYLRGFIEGWRAPEVAPNLALRRQLAEQPVGDLYARLREVDPESATRIGPHNKRRLVRALEVFVESGQTMSALQRSEPPPYKLLRIGLRQPRALLYQRIDERVRAMFASGWLDEVRRLREQGVTAATPAMSAHGYREALAVLCGT